MRKGDNLLDLWLNNFQTKLVIKIQRRFRERRLRRILHGLTDPTGGKSLGALEGLNKKFFAKNEGDPYYRPVKTGDM